MNVHRDRAVAPLAICLGVSWVLIARVAFAETTPVGSAAPAETSEPTSGEGSDGDGPRSETTPGAKPSPDVRGAIPIVAYTYSASGAPAHAVGVQGYGLGLFARGQNATAGGGGSIWAAPVDRLTLVGDAQRNMYGNFSPSAAVVFRVLGDPIEGWSLGALGKFKIDGFAAGPSHDEVESEIELGALVSFVRRGWYLDANGIAGRGTGDDGETDVEGRLRLGRSLGELFRLGVDSQARVRAAGPRYLPNGRTWDFAAGAQGLLALGEFFGSLTAGPSTMGLTSSNVGWTAVVSFGGTSL